jgi:hypothetical protein
VKKVCSLSDTMSKHVWVASRMRHRNLPRGGTHAGRPWEVNRTRLKIRWLIVLLSPMAPSSSSSSNFQSIFDASLQSYNNKTKSKLLHHPLATQLQSCDSPSAVLSVLQDPIQQFDQRRTSDERLKNWLNPTVSVLYSFSTTLGEGVGLVSLSSLSLYNLYSDCHLLDILSRKCDICRYRCHALGEGALSIS